MTDDADVDGVAGLYCQPICNGVSWLVYTKLSSLDNREQLEIGATDGFQRLYKQNFAWNKLHDAIGDHLFKEDVVSKFTEHFEKCRVRLQSTNGCLRLTLGNEERATFELNEVAAADIRRQLQAMLFGVCDRVMSLKNDLKLTTTSQSSTAGKSNIAMAKFFSTRKRKTYDTRTSLFNPGSKIRKPATGFAYDVDSDDDTGDSTPQ